MPRLLAFPAALLLSAGALADEPMLRQEGKASVYSARLTGHRTATGERVDPRRYTAASPTLPLGTTATVTNKANGRSVTVRINDRSAGTDGRILDLSRRAAKQIGLETGTAAVVVEVRASDQRDAKAKARIAAASQPQVAASSGD